MYSRFNPPPGWPPALSAWTPQPSWLLWVEDIPATAAAGSPWPVWCIGGGVAVALGSLLPFISNTSILDYSTVSLNSGGRGIGGIFGAIIVVLGMFAQRGLASGTFRSGTPTGLAVPLAFLSSLGALGYVGFVVAGLVGFQDEADLRFPVTATYSSSIGLVVSALGCVLAASGAIGMLSAAIASCRREG